MTLAQIIKHAARYLAAETLATSVTYECALSSTGFVTVYRDGAVFETDMLGRR